MLRYLRSTSFIVLFFLAFFAVNVVLFSRSAETVPVRVSIRAIDKSFPLAPYPENWNRDSYVDGPAFWRMNGPAFEIVSHSVQDPGREFRKIKVGDFISVIYSDDSTRFFKVEELVMMKYECPGSPFKCSFMVGDRKFTPLEFSAFVMRPGALVLHTSLAKDGDMFSAGQRFYIAYPVH